METMRFAVAHMDNPSVWFFLSSASIIIKSKHPALCPQPLLQPTVPSAFSQFSSLFLFYSSPIPILTFSLFSPHWEPLIRYLYLWVSFSFILFPSLFFFSSIPFPAWIFMVRCFWNPPALPPSPLPFCLFSILMELSYYSGSIHWLLSLTCP